MVSQSVLIIKFGVRSVIVLIITCYCMHTDDFNKSSKIVDICIYVLFIISCFMYSVR